MIPKQPFHQTPLQWHQKVLSTVSSVQLFIILTACKLITHTCRYLFNHLSMTFRRLFQMIIQCGISGTFAHFSSYPFDHCIPYLQFVLWLTRDKMLKGEIAIFLLWMHCGHVERQHIAISHSDSSWEAVHYFDFFLSAVFEIKSENIQVVSVAVFLMCSLFYV